MFVSALRECLHWRYSLNRLKSATSFLLPLLILATCIVYLLSGFQLSKFWHAWQGFDQTYVLIALLLAAANIVALALRLQALSSGEISFLNGCKSALLGLSLNVLLPAKLGEVGKISFLSDHGGKSIAGATRLVFWERFLDLHMLIGIILFGIALGLSVSYSVGMLLLVILLWVFLGLLKWRPNLLHKIVNIVPFAKVKEFLLQLSQQLSTSLRFDTIAYSASLSLLPWAIYALQVLFVLNISMAFDLTPVQQLAVIIAAMVSNSIPLTPGSLGVYEATIVAVLVQLQIEKEAALSAAIMMHGMQLIPVIFGAFWALSLAPAMVNNKLSNEG
jgi:uncharacterized protein (TIRG00374 family)